MRPLLVPELICSDLDKSLAFYVDLLGFRILYDRAEDRFAYLDRNGAELMLEEYAPGARMLAKAPFERPFGRGINFQIHVDDVAALHDTITRAGVPIFLLMEERWYRRDDSELGCRQFIVEDPDGYLIRLQQDLSTRPIKGTRQRRFPPEADLFTQDDLLVSPKDHAENVMIVDLLRNDLSRVCRPGSIRVPQLWSFSSLPMTPVPDSPDGTWTNSITDPHDRPQK